MPRKFVIYEVWTRARIIEAEDYPEAYSVGEPEPMDNDLSLSNWHAVAIDGGDEQEEREHANEPTGGLNYRQVTT